MRDNQHEPDRPQGSDPSFQGSDPARDDPARDGFRDALPGLARIYASSWWNTAEWTAETTVRSGVRLARAAMGRESATELVDDTAADIRAYARRMLGILDREGGAGGTLDLLREDGPAARSAADTTSLRAQGEELLRRSADVDDDEDAHPAYERILADLAPDEARILRLLVLHGPQPSVDIRAGLPLVSDLVAPGRNMIGADAGVRYTARVPAYLNNLSRLGLIWFSREPVRDRLRYQVVEAQPDVLEALRKGGRTARTVRRSIVLTPFGDDFCETCLPVNTAEFEALGSEVRENDAAASGTESDSD
jgi:abortive infection alpha-like protein